MNITNKIIYQIYPKSFNDTNDDGKGDINGIIEKLDYLKDLGVDMLWLTPIFSSPQNDNGYDVSDYYNVDPSYGTNQDLDRLIEAATARGIGLMFDMVLNHTSTEHSWFKKALKGENQYMDYYFFTKEKYNWESKFGGSAFEYVDDLKMYYLHLFDTTQADLNWENAEVFEELVKIINFWIDKGIKGFRFDVINLISKPEVFSNTVNTDGRELYTDGKNVHHLLKNLNKRTFGLKEDIITVGELSSTDIPNSIEYTKIGNNELDTIFNFHHLKTDYKDGNKWELDTFDFRAFKNLMIEWQYSLQENGGMMSLFLNNHDQPRAVSRFGNDSEYHFESATMLATATMLMRGVPFIYQGEEIGLPNAYFDNLSDYRDIESINAYNTLIQTNSHEDTIKILLARSRDNGRTPMPWNTTDYHGFSTIEPWIPFTKHTSFTTVEQQLSNPDSILSYYKRLIKLRKSDDDFTRSTIHFVEIETDSILAYTRGKYLIISNFSDESKDLSSTYTGTVVLSNINKKGSTIVSSLEPYECIILTID